MEHRLAAPQPVSPRVVETPILIGCAVGDGSGVATGGVVGDVGGGASRAEQAVATTATAVRSAPETSDVKERGRNRRAPRRFTSLPDGASVPATTASSRRTS